MELQYEMMMEVIYTQTNMKKILLLFMSIVFCYIGYGQKITALPAVTSTTGTSLLMVRSGASGNVLSQITKTNLFDDIIDYLETQDLATIITLQSDTIPKYSYGAGAGLAADSVLFAKDMDGFGVYTPKDTNYIVEFVQQRMSTGDSLKFNVYVGVYQTGVAADSMFTAPQATGVNQTTFTPNNNNVILPDQDCWIGLKAAQITAKRPYQWNMQMNGYKRNLSY